MSFPFDDFPFGSENDLRPVWDDPFDNFWGDLNDFLEPPLIPDVSLLAYPSPPPPLAAASPCAPPDSEALPPPPSPLAPPPQAKLEVKEERIERSPPPHEPLAAPSYEPVYYPPEEQTFWIPPAAESPELDPPAASPATAAPDPDVTMTDAFPVPHRAPPRPTHRVQHEIFHQYYPELAHPPRFDAPAPIFEVKNEDNKLKRRFELESECFLFETDPNGFDAAAAAHALPAALDDDDPTGGFKLPASKSPIMEAMVVCALNGWGIELVKHTPAEAPGAPPEIVFRVLDFDRYYRISRAICSKQRPTDDVGSRVKSLRRWFVNFPKKKVRCEKGEFVLTVKPQIAGKVSEIIERNTRILGVSKRRRRQ
eukprot:TRINITY_DN1141_c0_g1_i1.p1 TRINITY_DN1141_c0_g1~~TRINITY_DN1141_c0_g1_i1.p1  ORF type:complete len:367 (+),score=52.97 TRINITY_DN1141_c0_g1_i1:172-1272(+)